MIKNKEFSIRLNENHLKSIKDPYNSNIEVFVEFEDGLIVRIIVGTPKNFEYLMTKEGMNFYEPGLPWIIVKKLTINIIYEAIEGYMETEPKGYWLKLYYFWNDIDNSIFNQIEAVEITESDQLNLFIKLDQLKTQLNKLNKIKESEDLNSFQLDQQLTRAERYLNFTKALLALTSLLTIYQILEFFI